MSADADTSSPEPELKHGSGLCAGCRHAGKLLPAGRCCPGDACIRAHSGRQIDRFLRNNRDEAGDYLQDLFWERRAIAARYAPWTGSAP